MGRHIANALPPRPSSGRTRSQPIDVTSSHPPARAARTQAVSASGHRARLLEELYRLYYGQLIGFVLKLTLGDVPRAEDIVQETMARAWRHIHELELNAARPWLFTVARRIAIDRLRARSARPNEIRGDVLEFWPSSDDGIERVISALDVEAALAILPPDHREVLVNLYLRDRTIDECAASMGIPAGTVKSRAYYALRTLRKSLAGQLTPS